MLGRAHTITVLGHRDETQNQIIPGGHQMLKLVLWVGLTPNALNVLIFDDPG